MLPSGRGFSNAGRRPRRRRRGFSATGGVLAPAPLSTVPSSSSADASAPAPCTAMDAAYFQCYSHVGVHESMLKDHVRTETYRKAIMHLQEFIAGKVVLDVGCGTGVLSIFCAKAGACRVYAVDASDIALKAKDIVKENDLSDRIIVLHGRIEDVDIPEKVDVIISEWMGYILLYESMLGSVIFARDKWLKPGGLIMPSRATLYLAPITHSARYSDSVDFWRDVYGIKMSSMMPLAKQYAFMEPSVETITGENVLTWPSVVMQMDCYSVQAEQLESISAEFKFSSMLQAPLHGFAFWFDVEFSGPMRQQQNPKRRPDDSSHTGSDSKRAKLSEPIVLSTAPEDAPTHWQQTLLYMFDPIELLKEQIIEGTVTLSQNWLHARFMNIKVAFSTGGRSFVKHSMMN